MPTYPLKIFRKSIPTHELLTDVRSVAQKLKTKRLSNTQYHHHGQFHPRTIITRTGSWTAALQKVGLKPAHNFHLTHEQAITDLQRVAKKLNTQSPTIADYRQHGLHTPDAFRKRFGPWHRALLAADLRPGRNHKLTEQELFDNLKKIWKALGRQPRSREIRPPLSICTIGPYQTKFKTWTQALHAFHLHLNPKNNISATTLQKQIIPSTHINWRLRYQVLQRDNFKCQACGRSPATHPNITLQIDHIHPRSHAGPSTLENLQTLCRQCNTGKSDLLPISN